MIKGCKEKFFINQIFDENIRRLREKSFSAKKGYYVIIMLLIKLLGNYYANLTLDEWEKTVLLNPFSHSGHCIGPPSKISILV